MIRDRDDLCTKPVPSSSLVSRSFCCLGLSVPASLFVILLATYAVTAGISLTRQSLAPHFVYLADSFLHGRLDLLHVPDPPYDLTLYEGRWYVSFPPLPALLMMPAVGMCGLAVSDIVFSVVVGALGVSLFYLVLARVKVGAPSSWAWWCVLLGLGTPLWYCAALGSVWYTAHVAAVLCLCLYTLEVAGQNRPFLAGGCLGLGFLARAPVLLAFPLSVVSGLWRVESRREGVRFLLWFALGLAPALLGQATYNWARFGSPLEFGYRWMNSPGALLERQTTWGQFSLHFLPENLYTMLVRPPLVSLAPLHIEPDPWGMGLLFTCPALVLGLRGVLAGMGRLLGLRWPNPPMASPADELLAASLKVRALRLGLWFAIALVQVPSLFYFNTGSYQFGYRFALDWLPLGVMLVALETEGRLRWWSKALIVSSMLMHLWGVLWMYVNFNGQTWHLQYIQLLRQVFPLDC